MATVSCLEMTHGTNSSEEMEEYMLFLLDVSVFNSISKIKFLLGLLGQNINDNTYFIMLLRCTHCTFFY